MTVMPPNCPLTPEQFARLPIERQTSQTAIWIKDFQNPDDETLDAINAVCNSSVLPALAPLYYANTRLPAVPDHTHQHTPTGAVDGEPVPELAANWGAK